jgi:hypothetical protein
MSGTGKYTVYAPPASDRNTLLNKLFRSDDPIKKPVTQDKVGQENDVRQAIVAIALTHLTPSHQNGDLGLFPLGVNLDYSTAPLTEDVKWSRAGDPANPYAPDTSSPGPGKTEGSDKSDDPEISVSDLKPNYVPQGPKTGTKSPAGTAAKIIAANLLGVPSEPGESGGNI